MGGDDSPDESWWDDDEKDVQENPVSTATKFRVLKVPSLTGYSYIKKIFSGYGKVSSGAKVRPPARRDKTISGRFAELACNSRHSFRLAAQYELKDEAEVIMKNHEDAAHAAKVQHCIVRFSQAR